MGNPSPRARNTGPKKASEETRALVARAVKADKKKAKNNAVNQEADARPREPRPTAGIPAAPENVGRHGQRFWAETAPELDRMGVLALLDKAALESLVTAYDNYFQLREDVHDSIFCPKSHPAMFTKYGWPIIRKGSHVRRVWTSSTGAMIYSITGNTKINPLWTAMERAQARLTGLLVEFGMTPASRSRVETLPQDDEEKDEFDDI